MFNPLAVPNLSARTFLVQLSVVAGFWVGLFALNGWLFDRFAFSENVSWVFLPAALRMIAVLLAPWVSFWVDWPLVSTFSARAIRPTLW